jgi:hypothetical protein
MSVNYELVQLLVQMAHERRPVADMIRAVQPERHPVNVIRDFKAAFGLSLGEVKPIVGWLLHGLSDAWIQDLVWPCVDARRSDWSAE